jgi:hypothetical protein
MCLLQNYTSLALGHVVIRRRILDMRACAVERDIISDVFEFKLTHKLARRERIVDVLVVFEHAKEREREGPKEADIEKLDDCFDLFQFWRRLGVRIKKRRKRGNRDLYIGTQNAGLVCFDQKYARVLQQDMPSFSRNFGFMQIHECRIGT